MKKIKNIIFDLGNVLIDLDIQRTWQSFKHLLGEDFEKNLSKISPDKDIFIAYEIGAISEEEFFETLRKATDAPVSVRSLKEAWNAMLLHMPLARLEMLAELKKNYNVYLLSNTNHTHLEFVHGYLKTIHGITDFETRFFHKPYYSHLINLRKPNTDIYEFILKDAGLVPEETLFFDDMPANIEAAKKLNLRAILHPVGDDITAHVKQHVSY